VIRESGEKSARFGAVALVALAGRDRERAAEFVERELGGLLAAGPRAEDLVGTLLAFLEHGQSSERASRVRKVHRSTIRRHIREIEELLGHRIEERSAELILALRLRHLLRYRLPS
jgi:DNA-binding PucR family transcriptional regulator